MRNKLLLILCAAFLCACEGLKDDRNRPVPDNPVIAWLLSVEIDKLPSGTVAYDCSVYVAENPKERHDFKRTEINLPELLKIPGARLLKTNEERILYIGVYADGENTPDTLMYDTIPSFYNLKMYGFPQVLNFAVYEKDLYGKYHFRYD